MKKKKNLIHHNSFFKKIVSFNTIPFFKKIVYLHTYHKNTIKNYCLIFNIFNIHSNNNFVMYIFITKTHKSKTRKIIKLPKT